MNLASRLPDWRYCLKGNEALLDLLVFAPFSGRHRLDSCRRPVQAYIKKVVVKLNELPPHPVALIIGTGNALVHPVE